MTTRNKNKTAGRTISNNNNYTITTNNNCYTLCSSDEEQQRLTQGATPTSGLASLSATQSSGNLSGSGSSGVGNPEERKTNLISDSTIPLTWDYIKLDLFDNSTPEDLIKGKTKLKLALNIKKTGQSSWLSFNAQLNSPLRHMKRGLDTVTWEGEHYTNVRDSYYILKESYEDVRVSKFYEKGYANHKGKSVELLSVIVAQYPEEGCYVVNLHFDTYQWVWLMRGGPGYLSQAQRKQGIIATAGIRKAPQQRNIDARSIL